MPEYTESPQQFHNFYSWRDAGFGDELLPICPPTAKLAPDARQIDMGKTPAVCSVNVFGGGGLWRGMAKWTSRSATTDAELEAWTEWGASVGLQTRIYPALDLDLESRELVTVVLDELARMGLAGPVRRRSDGSARALVLYALDGGSEPVKKLRLKVPGDGERSAVEVLGAGQQCVIGGPHPRGGAYVWDTWPIAADLPRIDVDHAGRLILRLCELFEVMGVQVAGVGRTRQVGASVDGVAGQIAAAGGGGPAPVRAVPLGASVDGTSLVEIHDVAAALRELDGENYDDWFGVGCALARWAYGKGPHMVGLAFQLWHVWSAQFASYGGLTTCLDKWEHIAPNHEGSPTVQTLLGWGEEAKRQREAAVRAIAEAMGEEGEGACPLDEGLPRAAFPDVSTRGRLLPTQANARALLVGYGLAGSFDAYQQVLTITRLGAPLEFSMSHLREFFCSLASLCGFTMPDGIARQCIAALNVHTRNRVAEWLDALVWDGRSRIGELASTVHVVSGEELWPGVLRLWLVQCAAAAFCGVGAGAAGARPEYPYALIFSGRQGGGKTSWLRRLVPSAVGLDDVIVTGVSLDFRGGSALKDSVMAARRGWICELGEIDHTFKRADISQLKSFISNAADVFRLPYGSSTERFPRQTVFCGSVNDLSFLADSTGNRRFWPFAVDQFERAHGVDMTQLWAEVVSLYRGDVAWWPSPGVEHVIEQYRAQYEQQTPEEAMLRNYYDPAKPRERWVQLLDIFAEMGVSVHSERGRGGNFHGWTRALEKLFRRSDIDLPDCRLSSGIRQWHLPRFFPSE